MMSRKDFLNSHFLSWRQKMYSGYLSDCITLSLVCCTNTFSRFLLSSSFISSWWEDVASSDRAFQVFGLFSQTNKCPTPKSLEMSDVSVITPTFTALFFAPPHCTPSLLHPFLATPLIILPPYVSRWACASARVTWPVTNAISVNPDIGVWRHQAVKVRHHPTVCLCECTTCWVEGWVVKM